LHMTYTSDLDNINSPSLWKHWHRIVHKLSNIILLQYPKEKCVIMSVLLIAIYDKESSSWSVRQHFDSQF